MGLGSYSFLVGPMIALVAIGALMLVSRWMTGQQGSLVERPARRGSAEEYGLMIPVASPRSVAESDQVRARLREAGVASRSVDTTEGLRVMVWADDVEAARTVLDSPSR
ncbi:MAG: hypothetical protein MUF35_07240 [Candidatus Nanopelagicales bacterium]|nr:hypothetical protein [Candidatus Nanopelagicales bacterium]